MNLQAICSLFVNEAFMPICYNLIAGEALGLNQFSFSLDGNTYASAYTECVSILVLYVCGQHYRWPLLLTWVNFDPSTDN